MGLENRENRWEIKKIGLLNYWWYDEEEFEFADGRLILRGTNGSGKSVTMQSFIPLLLDGNKSPERLDPFNTRARKIEDYILGYGDDIKEENTSYLYMEFCKKETKNYLTIGMGLRAKKNQGVTFWGFIINDGRRIGKDFYLYKDIGNKIPLTKQELKNRIGEGGQVVDTTAAGDTFNGAVAVYLAEGKDISEAIVFANAAATLSVSRKGAQESIPSRDETEKFLASLAKEGAI